MGLGVRTVEHRPQSDPAAQSTGEAVPALYSRAWVAAMTRLALFLLAVAAALYLAASWSTASLRPRWQRTSMRVVQVEQLCPGGPRSYRLVGARDSLAIVVGGSQRFALGETVEVIR